MADTKISAETTQDTLSGAKLLGVNSTPLNRAFPGYAFWGEKGADVASAGTLVLGDDGDFFHITGSTGPITDIDFNTAKNGRMAWLEFDSTPTITHNATTLNLPGGASITAAAGDRMLIAQDSGDNVHVLAYVRAGVPPSPGPHVIIEDQKAQNTNGGTFTSGADRTRDLNTEVHDPFGLCSIASNQFTLAAGTWVIDWSAPACLVDAHQTLLYNVTDTAEVKRGSTEYAPFGNQGANRSFGSAVVTIAASKAFEIRHRCTTTRSSDGLGIRSNFGVEVYTIVKAWKVG